jgi:hypothetical protein
MEASHEDNDATIMTAPSDQKSKKMEGVLTEQDIILSDITFILCLGENEKGPLKRVPIERKLLISGTTMQKFKQDGDFRVRFLKKRTRKLLDELSETQQFSPAFNDENPLTSLSSSCRCNHCFLSHEPSEMCWHMLLFSKGDISKKGSNTVVAFPSCKAEACEHAVRKTAVEYDETIKDAVENVT